MRKAKRLLSVLIALCMLTMLATAEEAQEIECINEEPAQEEIPQEEIPQEEVPQEEPPQDEIPQEEIPQEEVPQEEPAQEEIPQEEIPQEEIPQEEPQQEEPPQEEPQQDPPPEKPSELNILFENARKQDEVWQIAGETCTVTWDACAESYTVTIADEQQVVYEDVRMENTLLLSMQDYAEGAFILTVSTVGDEPRTESAAFQWTAEQPDTPVKPGGMGRGGSMRYGRMTAKGIGGEEQIDAGFTVTPGKALTNSHANGTKDMTIYGTVEKTLPEDAMTRLNIGGQELSIALQNGEPFTGTIEGDLLTLTSDQADDTWTMNLRDLRTLDKSGIRVIRANGVDIRTDIDFIGRAYVNLRARGLTPKDFTLLVNFDEMRVSAENRIYSCDADGALCEIGE